MVRLEGGSIAEARVALGNMDTVPVRATAVESALAGSTPSEDAVAAACASAAEGTNPTEDLNGDATYRRHLATVLARRAVLSAVADAERGEEPGVQLEHHFEVPASRAETWARFNDLEQVVPCFPGASLTEVDGDEFTGTVKVKLGPISLQYKGSGRYL